MEPYKITGSMTRKELAAKYKVTEKTLRNRMKKYGLYSGHADVLFPAEVQKIITVLGYWELTINEY